MQTRLVVSFPCTALHVISGLAREHLEAQDGSDAQLPTATKFLAVLANRTGDCDGMYTWATTCEGLMPPLFVRALRPFWFDLLSMGLEGGPGQLDRVWVLAQMGRGPTRLTTINVRSHEGARLALSMLVEELCR